MYIAKGNPFAADKLINSFFDKTKALEAFPNMGRIVAEIKRPDVRELIEGEYRIIYHYSESMQQVTVLTVRHTKQILPTEEIKPPK